MAANLREREAFLLTLLGKNKLYHGSYIREKVKFALDPFASEYALRGMLDDENRATYDEMMGEVK